MAIPPSRSLDNRYRLVEPLGQGGMGRVWLGYDVMLHRQVAVKEIVTPRWITEDERTKVRERSLRALLEHDGRITPHRGAEVGLAVLNALGTAHRAGVVHRDVKPDNIRRGRTPWS